MEDDQVKEVLAKFGHEDFREGQREPIEAVLRGEDAVVVMPTGAGKSLCYQVTALMLPQVQSVFNVRREKFYRDRRRLRKMIDFAYFEGCRHKFILDYFGDQSPTRTCDGCDNCDKGQAVGCRAAVNEGTYRRLRLVQRDEALARQSYSRKSREMNKQIIVYEPNEQVKMEVKTDGETVWLSQDQMCRLFGRDQSVIARHIKNIFKEGELDEKVVYAKFAYTTRHGAISGKTQTKEVGYYNLDVVISVGYRVKSIEGTRFRQWATRILREMLLKRLEDMREIAKLKRRVDVVEGDIKQIKGGMNYLVKQLSGPDTPRRKIGFGAKPGETSTTPYGRAK